MSSSHVARSLLRVSRASSSSSSSKFVRHATTSLRMPAMSPTMTEGGVGTWKIKEGDAFATGDVILEVETDKATMDIEAQDDGVMGKILVKEGTSKIPVGQIIALLAEEGDDLSAIEVPKDLAPEGSSSSSSEQPEEVKAESKPAPKEEKKEEPTKQVEPSKSEHKEIKHSQPILPSVSRLLHESSLSSSEISKLKGSGKRGMLTKGDVLKALGKISNVYGSAEKLNLAIMGASGVRKGEKPAEGSAPAKAPEKPLDGAAFRRLILQGMTAATAPAQPIVPATPHQFDADFDAILAPYAALMQPSQPAVSIPGKAELEQSAGRDEFAGLY